MNQLAAHPIVDQIVSHPLLQRFAPQAKAVDDYPEPNYRIRILSHDPFVAHLENFITPEERSYIVNSSAEMLKPSDVMDPNGTTYQHPDRTSSTAFLPYEDPIVSRIALRAGELQGWYPRNDIDVQVTSYKRGQQYVGHFDWFDTDPVSRGEWDRISTIFGLLDVNCTQCGTRFPKLKRKDFNLDDKWCEFIECEGDANDELTFKASAGNAVFWKNLYLDGTGDRRMLHAGLPVPEGSKVGLNIWTRIKLPQAAVEAQQASLGIDTASQQEHAGITAAPQQ